jgi:hypothetical protein
MPDPTFHATDNEDVSLDNFFSRPLKIGVFTWPVGTEFAQTINPWTVFFSNPRVLNRIVNYNLLSCKLKVKFVLNGSGFHYGRVLASYQPLFKYDGFTLTRDLIASDLVGASQRPHVFLNPTDSMGGIMTLPFVWPNNALLIPFQEWADMGRIWMRSFQNLKHANGADDGITITVFAWAEDVKLSVPTANQPGSIQPQTGSDEYGNGIVSKPANVIAGLATKLSTIPSIAPYAMATATVASAVGQAADAYGFSRPVQVEPTRFVEPVFVDNMANVSGHDTSQKLTFDPKAELTIDPRTMGLGGADEMTIASIASKESYLTQFNWAVADTPERLLWNSVVTPSVWNDGPGTELHMPACCFACLPFRSWRGTMRFRFQIVASAYHKGRLKVVYDPSYPLTNEYNTNYMYIVDIAKERDFTVDIGWGSARSMVDHANPGADPPQHRVAKLSTVPSYIGNGIVSVYVVNDLAVPNTMVNNDVAVNVFVSAGPDFEVFNPSNAFVDSYTYFNPPTLTPQTSMQPYAPASEGAGMEQEDVPEYQTPVTQLATKQPESGIDSIFYGDPIRSIRQVMKRYCFTRAWTARTTAANWHSWIIPNMPMQRGNYAGAYDTAVTGAYGYNNVTPITYFTPAFVCRRGSTRFKYLREATAPGGGQIMAVSRLTGRPSAANYTSTATAQVTTLTSVTARDCLFALPTLWAGGAVTVCDQKPVLSITLPFFANMRFAYARDVINHTGDNQDEKHNQFHQLVMRTTGVGTSCPTIYSYAAAGDDFTLSWFIGCPVMWRVPRGSDPAAA